MPPPCAGAYACGLGGGALAGGALGAAAAGLDGPREKKPPPPLLPPPPDDPLELDRPPPLPMLCKVLIKNYKIYLVK